MKNTNHRTTNMKLRFIIISFIIFPQFIFAQCDCNVIADPYGYCNNTEKTVGIIGSSCGLATISDGIFGQTKTCNNDSNFYYYTVFVPYHSLAPNGTSIGPVTGYACKVTGGVIDSSYSDISNFSASPLKQAVHLNHNENSVNFVANNSNITQLKFRVHWTDISANNIIQLWLYTQKDQSLSNANYPNYLSYYSSLINCNTSNVPTTPKDIYLIPSTNYPFGFNLSTTLIADAIDYNWIIKSGHFLENKSPYKLLCNSNILASINGPQAAANQKINFTLSAGNGCGVSSKNFTIEVPKNPYSAYVSDTVKIFPNPAFQNLFISGITNETVEICITNIAGIVVKKIISTNYGLINIDINNIPTGLYFVRILYVDGHTISKKIWIN